MCKSLFTFKYVEGRERERKRERGFLNWEIHKKNLSSNTDESKNNLPSEFSSFAFCPAANTTSTGRGANDDQYSFLAAAISEWTPARHSNANHQTYLHAKHNFWAQ